MSFQTEPNIPGIPALTNLDDDNLSVLNPPSIIGQLLGTAETNPVDHAVINNGVSVFTGNSAHIWIQFDLPAASAGNVVSASLNLFALDGKGLTGAFDNPAPGLEVTTQVYEADKAWNEQIITWNNEPLPGALVNEVVQDHVNDWVSFDVTNTVKAWLSGAKVNNGLFLAQKDVVFSPGEFSGLEDLVASLYPSSAFAADPSLRPYLEIILVPEPASLGLLGLGSVLALRRR